MGDPFDNVVVLLFVSSVYHCDAPVTSAGLPKSDLLDRLFSFGVFDFLYVDVPLKLFVGEIITVLE